MIVTPTRNQLFVRTLAVRAFVLGLCFSLPSLVAAQSLPPGWTTADVGTPVVQGAATFADGRFSVRGAGADIRGLSDEFMFVYQPLTRDGDIIARVEAVENTHVWAKAGVMIRASLAADSPHVFAAVSAASGRAFQRRDVAGGSSAHTTGGAGSAPVWLKIERRASTLKAYRSADRVTWTAMGTDVISMPETVYVGLAVTAHNVDVATEAVFSNVVVTPIADAVPNALPIGWTARDIGNPQVAGSTQHNAGTYTVKGAGRDIWADFDEFQYAYRRVTGDIDIVARVTAVENVNAWTKAGVMIRDALTTNAAHASMFVTPGSGVAFQRRPTAGGLSQTTSAGTMSAPYWVRLERRGAQIRAFHSGNGTAWTQVGTMPLSLPTVYIGLAVTSHNTSVAATALFDNVVVRTPGANQAPTVSLTAPANNASFTAPASVTISATAADTDGTVAKVDFYNGTTRLGSATTSPYAYTWSGVPVGTYTLRAVATDNGGATTTSAARTITVRTTTNQPPSVALTAPADGATYTAPATITMTATASDADGTVAGVDFFYGTTLVSTDSSSPYSVTWSNAPAGTYAITAVARDNGGVTTTSAPRSITVTGTTLPAGWTGADIGQPAVAGSARHSAGTFTLEGAGTDIWDTSDQFQYVYRQVTGDIEISSRVVSLENTWEYAKAGVMIRETLAANAVHASLVVTPERGTNFYRRLTPGAATQPGPTGPSGAPYWVKLERRGTLVTASQSSDGVTWTSVGTMTISVPTLYVGLAVTSVDVAEAATGVFDNVVVRTPAPVNQAPTVALTAPANGATFPAPGTVTMTATASDTDGTIASVSFYAGTTLIGTATTSPYSVTWNNVAAGSYSLTAVARDDDGATKTSAARTITVTGANRPPTTSLTDPANGASFTAPATVTMTATASDTDGTIASVTFYAGTTLIGSDTTSPYNVTWNNVAAGSYSLTAVARDNGGVTTTSAPRSITVTGTTLPAGWTGADIGQPAVAGSARHSAGTFTLEGAGTDIWDTSDQFQYVYRQVTGDIEISSRVVSLENTWEYAKAGVMIRETLAANAVHASLVVTPERGTNFYRRLTPGAATQPGPTGPSGAPYWVKLERRGTLVTASQSSDGVTWTSVGTMTISVPTLYVGLAVTSVDVAEAATGVFDNVVVRTPAPVNQAPTVAMTAPANGATFPAPGTVTINANASDTDGTVAKVEFYNGTTLLGADTTAPYSYTWSGVPVGTYTLKAIATDNSGAATTSATRTITVGTPPPVQHRAIFNASSNHATAVDRYVLNIYPSGANPDTATPVATRDLGKPSVVSGECNVDVSQTVQGLASGNYIATVTAVGPGGSARSAPSAPFTR